MGNENFNLMENKINEDLQNLCIWLRANHLSLNIVKSEYTIIGSVQRIRNLSREPSLFIGNVKLKRVKHKKILGVTVDENLSWHEHISNTVKKVKSGLSVLRQIRDFVPVDALKKVYYAVIQPHFDYCSSVWDNCNKGFKQKLQKLQNRVRYYLFHTSTVRQFLLLYTVLINVSLLLLLLFFFFVVVFCRCSVVYCLSFSSLFI